MFCFRSLQFDLPDNFRLDQGDELLKDRKNVLAKSSRHADIHDVITDFQISFIDPDADIRDALCVL